MTRSAHTRGLPLSGVITEQAGFTLIELLVTMLLSIVVIGGGTYGMARAFRSSSETSARTAATNQAEVRFEVLTRDLRQAVTCPALVNAGSIWTGTLPAGLSNFSASSGFTLQMCDPAPGLSPSAAGSQLPQAALVNWTCFAAGEYCTRQTQNISGNNVIGTPLTTNTITGVKSLSLTGLVQGWNPNTGTPDPLGLQTIDTLGVQNFTQLDHYQVVTPTANNTIYWLTWVGISAQIVSLATPDSTTNTTPAMGTAPVSFQTGVTLRN